MAAVAERPSITATDRFTFTLFLALTLHLVVLLGVGFGFPEPRHAPASLEVILAKHKASEAPEDADFIAQANQEGSGTEEEKLKPTTDQLADFDDAVIRKIKPIPQQATQKEVKPKTETQLSTTGQSDQKTIDTSTSEEDKKVTVSKEEMLANLNRQIEMASYEAALEEKRQAYAKRPKKRVLTSASAVEARDAAYLDAWRLKIERIGNMNYPSEARKRKLYGQLRLLVSINSDGSLREMKILKSSGHRMLDQAAMQIVKLASPFSAFPPEIKQDTDILEIIRTWRFEKGDYLSSY
ncbi:energy transducer TonB [Ketobacter sp. MCCC 1A13808]|uniref:energy transducer TonB n=1 Tax=Ketobacter sp. MCCC 1A13808 TaxID=2602738 RepID=UPI000F139E07|nr:energy transducer TonB [Ketobacter sp. MCCC 1A13808]MVF13648.1 energy transducer TonB [Ketobacter sp. MCCC 1A13808]RLP53148.1 MAG: energy transducer TonB [Ketobacter sp.]